MSVSRVFILLITGTAISLFLLPSLFPQESKTVQSVLQASSDDTGTDGSLVHRMRRIRSSLADSKEALIYFDSAVALYGVAQAADTLCPSSSKCGISADNCRNKVLPSVLRAKLNVETFLTVVDNSIAQLTPKLTGAEDSSATIISAALLAAYLEYKTGLYVPLGWCRSEEDLFAEEVPSVFLRKKGFFPDGFGARYAASSNILAGWRRHLAARQLPPSDQQSVEVSTAERVPRVLQRIAKSTRFIPGLGLQIELKPTREGRAVSSETQPSKYLVMRRTDDSRYSFPRTSISYASFERGDRQGFPNVVEHRSDHNSSLIARYVLIPFPRAHDLAQSFAFHELIHLPLIISVTSSSDGSSSTVELLDSPYPAEQEIVSLLNTGGAERITFDDLAAKIASERDQKSFSDDNGYSQFGIRVFNGEHGAKECLGDSEAFLDNEEGRVVISIVKCWPE